MIVGKQIWLLFEMILRKFFFLFLFSVVLQANVQTSQVLEEQKSPNKVSKKIREKKCQTKCVFKPKILTDITFAYFRPTSATLRNIYGSAWLNSRLTFTVPARKGFNAFFSVNYLRKTGRSLGGQNRTRITQVPLDLGLRYYFCIIRCLDIYLSGAGRAFIIRVKNDSPFVRRRVHKFEAGGIFGLGLNYYPWRCFVVNVFADYSFSNAKIGTAPVNVNRVKRDPGGLTAGGGIGIRF